MFYLLKRQSSNSDKTFSLAAVWLIFRMRFKEERPKNTSSLHKEKYFPNETTQTNDTAKIFLRYSSTYPSVEMNYKLMKPKTKKIPKSFGIKSPACTKKQLIN